MAQDTREIKNAPEKGANNIVKCSSKVINNKMSVLTLKRLELRWSCTFNSYILLALVSTLAFVTIVGAETQSTYKHEVNELRSSSYVKDTEVSELLPHSSINNMATSSSADIANTGNSQVFSTALAGQKSEETSGDDSSSVLSPWELPGGSRTQDVVDVSPSSSLPSTELSKIHPTVTQEQSSEVKQTDSLIINISENDIIGVATEINDILDESSGNSISHNIDRFQPTVSYESNIDKDSETSSINSESLRVARSIDHSATASSGSRQLVGRAIQSGERLPTDEKTMPHLVVPNGDKVVISTQTGEGRRAPRVEHVTAAVGPLGRQQLPPHPGPPQNWTTNASGRRSEPDIQDIIGGIVKLLGGNVNVAAVQGPPPLSGRPLRPMSTRINNRGPPRITDLAYEPTSSSTPASAVTSPAPPSSTRPPPPYPFDRPPPPPQNIPFPGMENSESFMSPPPMPQDSSSSTSHGSTRPRPVWPRPQLPNRRPAYPDVPQQPEETSPTLETTSSTSEDPSSSSSSTSTSTTTVKPTSEAETTPLPQTTTSTTTTEAPPSPEINVIGIATPIQIESSIPEIISTSSSSETPAPPIISSSSSRPSYARPGLVLDDPEFKPGGAGNVPIITAPVRGHRPGALGEVFDVTVTAVQGPGNLNTGRPQVFQIPPEGSRPGVGGDVITSPEDGQHFVSIDGKRTYINLFPTEAGVQGGEVTAAAGGQQQQPQLTTQQRPQTTPTQKPDGGVIGAGFAVPDLSEAATRPGGAVPSKPPQQPPPRRRPPWTKRPPVRIDTCIVGDASTCDEAQNEACRTEQGVSSCHCRPGYSRRKHRDPCRRMVSVMLNMRVDRMYEKRTSWSTSLTDPETEDYQQLQWEAVRALDSAMGMTPFSDEFLGARVNGFLKLPANKDGTPSSEGVLVNVTMQLVESAETVRSQVKQDIQRHLQGAITRRNNNIGESALWVDKPPGAISALQDLDECSSPDLNDCNSRATCTNVFGTYRCSCNSGLRDPWAGNVQRSGRTCEACPADHCSNRGECTFQPGGERLCTCTGNFYGSQCELDGEVLGVAIGATVAAVLIIGLTLLGLCMWSRRWNREQQKAEMLSTRTGITSPVFSYMAAAAAASSAASVKSGIPPGGAPAPFVSMEDRLRWAHIADVMAQNHYAPEPGMPTLPTRPSSAVFGAYPQSMRGTLTGTLPSLTMMHLQRPPPPTMGPPSSSDEEDNRDLLGRNFHVPRPRSRAASIANQSGIYYDLDYDTRPTPVPAPRSTLPRPPQIPPPIPMATYMQGGRFFRS